MDHDRPIEGVPIPASRLLAQNDTDFSLTQRLSTKAHDLGSGGGGDVDQFQSAYQLLGGESGQQYSTTTLV